VYHSVCYCLTAQSRDFRHSMYADCQASLYVVPGLTQDLFLKQEPLYAPTSKHLVTSTCSIWRCHSNATRRERGTRFQIRKTFIRWSPLTESSRRPSPYHVSPCGSVPPGRPADLPIHERRQALTSARQALASTPLPLNLPLRLISKCDGGCQRPGRTGSRTWAVCWESW
jgi:hypothetical protein